eukprot:2539058-Ditylum_brightwellii.AAC.1
MTMKEIEKVGGINDTNTAIQAAVSSDATFFFFLSSIVHGHDCNDTLTSLPFNDYIEHDVWHYLIDVAVAIAVTVVASATCPSCEFRTVLTL